MLQAMLWVSANPMVLFKRKVGTLGPKFFNDIGSSYKKHTTIVIFALVDNPSL